MTSCPSRAICPEVGSSRPARIFISVDLPAPFGPSRPNMPGGTSRVIPWRAVTGPGYTFTRSRIVSMLPYTMESRGRFQRGEAVILSGPFEGASTMNRRLAATTLVLSALLAGGVSLAAPPETAPAADTAYLQEIETLRKERNEGLKKEDGWFTLVGLFWLEPGENRFGSGPDNRVIFPEGRSPAYAGTLIREGDAVKVRVAPGVTITSDGQPVTEKALTSDAQGKPTVLQLGSLSFFA